MARAEKNYWVRNEQGRTWGPYNLESLERLRGIISEKWEVAIDGKKFRALPEFPELTELAAAPRRAPPLPIPKPPPQGDETAVRDAARAAARAAVEQARSAKTGASSPSMPRVEVNPEAKTVGTANIGTPNIGTATSSGTPVSSSGMPAVSDKPMLPDDGDLEVLPPVRLYALAALSSASGWLQLESGSGKMLQISFRRGTPEHLESDDPELSLLAFLRRRGTISPEQALAATAHTEKAGVDLVTALFQLQLIAPADAHQVLNGQMLALLDRALMIWRGRFSFERDAPPPPGAFPLGQRWTLLTESIRRLDAKPLRARLGARLQAPVMRSGGLALGRVEELALTAQEARFYAAIDGVKTAEELLRDSPDPSATLRLLYLLTELGHLSFSMDAESSRTAHAAPPPTPTPPPPATQPAEAPSNSRIATPLANERVKTPIGTAPVARPPAPAEAPRPPSSPPPPAVSNPNLAAVSRGTGSTSPNLAAPPASATAATPVEKPRLSPSAQNLAAVKRAGTQPNLGAIARSPAPSAASRAPSAPPPAAAPATFVSGPPNETPAAMQQRLTGVLAKIEKADQFTALGLERKATTAEVKKAFFQLARELHPDTVQDGNTELRELKSRLFARVNEAAQVLSDEKRRKEHEDELDGKGNVDVARIFAAEEAFQRGEIMIKARKLVEGLALIDEAITLNADEGEFYAWRGWARFLLSKDRKTQHPLSAADCRKCLAMVAVCVPAWLFLGNMAKAMGDLPEAEKNFRKVVEHQPKHVEALRELRAMGKKLEK